MVGAYTKVHLLCTCGTEGLRSPICRPPVPLYWFGTPPRPGDQCCVGGYGADDRLSARPSPDLQHKYSTRKLMKSEGNHGLARHDLPIF